mgnify:CR=1 FL=1
MARKETPQIVIAASPLSQEKARGSNDRFYDSEGNFTGSKLDAATFLTWDDAKEFAEKHKIDLNGEVPYITKIWFTEAELNEYWRRRDR